jgi:hypothetical protein
VPLDRRAAARSLVAASSLQDARGRERAWLRVLVVVSLPAWAAACGRPAPVLPASLALLAQGLCLAMAVRHAVRARRWLRRWTRLDPAESGVSVHAAGTPWEELRTAAWHGLALASLVAGAYAGLGREVPRALLAALGAVGWVLLLLVATAETLCGWARPRAGGGRL